MNVDRLGRWDVAPRAHPNDGRADVVEVDAAMGVTGALAGAGGGCRPAPTCRTRRSPTRRTRSAEWTFERPLRLWVDGVERGTVRSLRVDVEPDAAVVHC